MTHRPNAITHTREYSDAQGGTVYIYCFRSLYEAKPVPPDIKFWRRHCLSLSLANAYGSTVSSPAPPMHFLTILTREDTSGDNRFINPTS